MRSLCILLACACLAGMATVGRAQTQLPPEQQSEQKVVINSAEVPFDVVVLDK